MRHLSETEIETYRNKTCSPEQYLAINDHIFECEKCGSLFETPDKMREAYEYLATDLKAAAREHLTYEELEGYIDRTLPDEDIESLDYHLERCAECRGEIRELNALKARIDIENESRSEANKQGQPSVLPKAGRSIPTMGLAVVLLAIASIFGVYAYWAHSRISSQRRLIAQYEQERDRLQRRNAQLSIQLPGPAGGILKDNSFQIAMNKRGELLGLGLLPPGYLELVKGALTSGHVSVSTLPATAKGKAGTQFRGTTNHQSFEILSPTGTNIENTRPVFEWQHLEGAKGYIVILDDLTTGQEIESARISQTTWTPDRDLIRGHQYAWMVEAEFDGGESVRAPALNQPFATFSILDERQAGEISEARQAWGSSHLVMGVVYAKAGLISEAEKELRALAEANPDSIKVRSLLESVQAKKISHNH